MKKDDYFMKLFGKKNDGNRKYLDEGVIVIDGVSFDLGEDEWDLEVFFEGKDEENFVGFWDEGYRGEGNYDGLYFEGDEKYYVDVINDGVVINLIERV